MRKLLYKWYEHDLVWDFYDRGFKDIYKNQYQEFLQATWKVDVYEGIDGNVVFINGDSEEIPTQVKTSGAVGSGNLKLNLAYINENGDDSAFGLYFNNDRVDMIRMFAFGFPFIGKLLLVDFDVFWAVWLKYSEVWKEKHGYANGLNKYISLPIRELLKHLYPEDYILQQKIEPVVRSLLEVKL